MCHCIVCIDHAYIWWDLHICITYVLYGLLNELANSGIGCYMGGVFVGATGYADDLKLLTPSVNALKIL